MPPTLESLGINQLCKDDRIALVMAIWESIAAEPGPPLLTDVQRLELDRRAADHAAHPAEVIPWPEVKAEVLARIRQ
jgi:putative addiction module component (TIGR02574 family)